MQIDYKVFVESLDAHNHVLKACIDDGEPFFTREYRGLRQEAEQIAHEAERKFYVELKERTSQKA